MAGVGKAGKSSTNPHFRSKYADLATCHDAALPALEANGFAFPMFPHTRPGALSVTALLLHSSGEFLEGTITIPLKQGANAQDVLAAETYARRGLYCMVGVVPDDDDDGETAVGRGNGHQERKEPQRTPPQPPQKAPKDVGREVVASLPKEAQATFKRDDEVPARPASVPPGAILNDEPINDEMIDRIKKAFAAKGMGARAATEFRNKVAGKTEGFTMADGEKVLHALRQEVTV